MKIWFKKIVLLVGGMSWVMLAYADPLPADNSPSSTVQAIQQAADPSAVIAAYSDASDRSDPRVKEAFVNRMVDLGAPEMAYHQAQKLAAEEPNNAVALAVVAHVDLRRGYLPDAITAINTAAPLAPENVFVQRTAGEVLAWYDARGNTTSLSQRDRDNLEHVRGLMASNSAYNQTYNMARQSFTSQPYPNQQPAATTTPPPQYQAQSPAYDYSAPGYYDYSSGTPYYYPSYPYYYPDYAYWGPGWDSTWWWGGPVIGFDVFPGRRFHDHDHDHDRRGGFHNFPSVNPRFHGGFEGRGGFSGHAGGGFGGGHGGGGHR